MTIEEKKIQGNLYVNFTSLTLKFQDLSRCCRSQTIRTFLVKFLISSNFGQRQRLQCKQKVGSCVRNDCGLISAAAEDISVNLSLKWSNICNILTAHGTLGRPSQWISDKIIHLGRWKTPHSTVNLKGETLNLPLPYHLVIYPSIKINIKPLSSPHIDIKIEIRDNNPLGCNSLAIQKIIRGQSPNLNPRLVLSSLTCLGIVETLFEDIYRISILQEQVYSRVVVGGGRHDPPV